jgi:tetratricopeptide (TPR) repeat protein
MSTLDTPFLLDDVRAVEENPNVIGDFDPARLATSNAWGNAYGYENIPNYRPLSVLTLAATHAVVGLEPVAYRVVNVLLYAALCIAVFLLLLRLGVSRVAALAAGLGFALHPVHVEAVAFAVNREELLAGLFFLGAAWIVLTRTSVAGPGARSDFTLKDGVAFGILFALALLSKESALSLPFLAVAALCLYSGPSRWRPVAIAGAVSLAGLVAYFGLRLAVFGRLLAGAISWRDNPLVLFPWLDRIPAALAVLWEAAGLLESPLSPTVDYGHAVLPLDPAWILPRAVGGACVLLGLLVLAMAGRRRIPLAALGALWAVVTYLPFSSLVFPSSIVLAERTLLLPSIGVTLIAAALLDRLATSRVAAVRVLVWVPAAAWLAVFGVMSADRAGDFRSGTDLYAASLVNRPGSARLHNNLGYEHLGWQRLDAAESEFRKALAIEPSNPDAHANLGLLLAQTHRPAEAFRELFEALKVRPGMVRALSTLCLLSVATRQWELAVQACDKATALGGDVGEALVEARRGRAENNPGGSPSNLW